MSVEIFTIHTSDKEKRKFYEKRNSLKKKLPFSAKLKVDLGNLANSNMGGTFETSQNFDRLIQVKKGLADAKETLSGFHSEEGDNSYRSGGGVTTTKDRGYWEGEVSRLEMEEKILEAKLGIKNKN